MSDTVREFDAARQTLERRAATDGIREIFTRRFSAVAPERIAQGKRSAIIRAFARVQPLLDERGLKICVEWFSPETSAEREYAERWPTEWPTVETVELPGTKVLGMAERDRIPGIKSPIIWLREDLPEREVLFVALHELGHIILDTHNEDAADAFAIHHMEGS